MRLTELVSPLVESAITDQADPGEIFHYEVLFQLAGRPGGYDPELVLVLVGYDGQGQPVMAPPVSIRSATTTQAVVDGHVATTLTWIRAQ